MRAVILCCLVLSAACCAPPAALPPTPSPPAPVCLEAPPLGERVLDAWSEGARVFFCVSQGEGSRCWSVDADTGAWALAAPRPYTRAEAPRVTGSSWSLCDAQGCAEVEAPSGVGLCAEGALVAFDAARERVALLSTEDCGEGGGALALFEVSSRRLLWRHPWTLPVSEVCQEAVGFLGAGRIWTTHNVCAGPGAASFVHRVSDGALVAATYGAEYPPEDEVNVRFARAPVGGMNTYGARPVEGVGGAWIFWSTYGDQLIPYDPSSDQWGTPLTLSWGDDAPTDPEGALLVALPSGRAAMVSVGGDLLLVDLARREVSGRLAAPRCQGEGQSAP
jgi:hypothetical protein